VRAALPDGTRLYFEVVGNRLVPDGPRMRELPTMILLHGGPGYDHSTIVHGLAGLADVAQLVAYDHRGQGRSDGTDPSEWLLDTWTRDLVDFCAALDIEKPIVLGQSFGGVVALAAAARYPDFPSKLVVSSSLARFRLDRALPMFEQLGGAEARDVAERHFTAMTDATWDEFTRVCMPLYTQSPRDPDVMSRAIVHREVAMRFFDGEGFTLDLFPELALITAPTLVLGGELDPITPVADAEDIAAAIPHSRLQIFEGAGHGVFRDKPEEAMALIRDFVSEEGTQPAAG
jgi:pimeloyl-ACP methyl ester carboxylesterase